MQRIIRLMLALIIVGLLTAQSVAAHERRSLGPYQLIVGFDAEPALSGEPNGAQLRVRTEADQKPVEGLEKTLKVEVTYGKNTMSAELDTVFGEPGLYVARFVPSAPGDYSFHFTGTINEVTVDERFESSPSTFSSVADSNTMKFPPVVAETKSATDLGTVLGGGALVLSAIALVISGLSLRRRAAA